MCSWCKNTLSSCVICMNQTQGWKLILLVQLPYWFCLLVCSFIGSWAVISRFSDSTQCRNSRRKLAKVCHHLKWMKWKNICYHEGFLSQRKKSAKPACPARMLLKQDIYPRSRTGCSVEKQCCLCSEHQIRGIPRILLRFSILLVCQPLHEIMILQTLELELFSSFSWN